MYLQNPGFLVFAILLVYPMFKIVNKEGDKRKIFLIHMIVILTLIISASSPIITQEKKVASETSLKILEDNTTSMNVIKNFGKTERLETQIFVSDNNSKIFTKAAETIENQKSYLLITDGRTIQTPKKLIETAKIRNSSISILKLREENEAAIKIKGPSTTVPNSENSFKIQLSKTSDQPTNVTIDQTGKESIQTQINSSYSFNRVFDSEGTYKIQASIKGDDVFSENNRYYKTVKVREKPKIMVIGDRGELEHKLKQFYKIENNEVIPEELNDYYSIIVKKEAEIGRNLKSYLIEGNGLLYTAEIKKEVPRILPVIKGKKDNRDTGAKIILLIDSSFGTGECIQKVGNICLETSSEGGNAKESIQIGYALVEQLSKNNEVGVVAYNKNWFLVSESKSLAEKKDQIKEVISRISTSGPSFHNKGLKGADDIAEENDTIVMLTDGEIGEYEREENVELKITEKSSVMKTKLITVGMGDNPNEPLLREIAENTGGYYLENNEAGRLKFNFGAGGGNQKHVPIAVSNPDHYITENLDLQGTETQFQPVKVKSTGQKLVSGANGNPVLSTWRYGLGRVSTFTADNDNLENLIETDPSLVSRTISWSVGNPYRKQENWSIVQDTSKPKKPLIKSSKPLKGLSKSSKAIYTGKIDENQLGFNKWKENRYAYNYNIEKEKVGQNMEKLKEIPQETEGKIYRTNEIEKIKNNTSMELKMVEKKTKISPYLIALAMMILITEIGYRKSKGKL